MPSASSDCMRRVSTIGAKDVITRRGEFEVGWLWKVACVLLLSRVVFLLFAVLWTPAPARAQDAPLLPGRIIAAGIPGVGAVSPVGFFHPGGAIHDNPTWTTYLQPRKPLDPRRVLVAATSAFNGARPAVGDPESSILSIDPVGQEAVAIPPDLSPRGGQPAMLDGRAQVFTAPGQMVGHPVGIAVGNGAGWVWSAQSSRNRGSLATSNPAGASFRPGEDSTRVPAIAAALIGKNPDTYQEPVLAILLADGALMQVPFGKAPRPLAPAGTITPIPPVDPSDKAATVTRAGMVFNWVPDRILYITDPIRNTVVALKLAEDGGLFRVESVRRIEAAEMAAPIDIAPAVPEVANPGLSSNTVLAGGADFFVVNRGNGVILRMNQAGQTVAARRVAVLGTTLGGGRLNGIAISRDAQRIWLTVTGPLPGFPDSPGALIEVPAFGPGRSVAMTQSQQNALVDRGAELFQTAFTPEQGLGPLYNGTSCRECHQFPSLGGAGPDGLAVVYRVGRFNNGAYDPMLGGGGPVSRKHSISPTCKLTAGIPSLANLVSVRNTPSLFGDGLIDRISDQTLRARAAAQAAEGTGIAGRPHYMRDAAGQERVGKFGWKADAATLEQFIAEAMRNEMGLTTPLAPQDIVAVPPGCGLIASPKFDSTVTRALTAFVASLPAPNSSGATSNAPGAALFATLGCATCHTPSLPAGDTQAQLYSDLLLHDMGPSLDDGVVQGQARGRDWRTTPLWGLGVRVRYLHDGRATSLTAAIAAHEGEAMRSANAFRALSADAKEKLLNFLGSL